MSDMAERMDLKRASSYQYYESETGYGRDRLPPHFVAKLKVAVVGLGDPPITVEEIADLDVTDQGGPPLHGEARVGAEAAPGDRMIIRDMLRTAYGIDFIRVPEYDMGSAESMANLVRGLNSTRSRLIDATWFGQGSGRPAEGGVLVVAAGDALSPAIRVGDVFFVDTTIRAIGIEGVYLLAFNETVALRRCARNPTTGAVRMLTGESLDCVESEPGDRAPVVVGRVSWVGRSL